MPRRKRNRKKGAAPSGHAPEKQGRTTKVRRRTGEACTTRNKKPLTGIK